MIREYKKDDLNTIAQIWLDASIIAHSFIPKEYWLSKVDDMVNIYIPASKTYVWEDSATNTINGFISLIDDYIAALFVAPSMQGKGIGKKLMSFVKDKHENLALGVYSENTKSVEFYTKQGFKIIEEKVEENTGHKEFVMNYIK